MNQFQRLAVAFVLMCAVLVGGYAYAAVAVTRSASVNLLRGSTTVETVTRPTSGEAWEACSMRALQLANADTRTSGTVTYRCQTERRDAVAVYTPSAPPPPVPVNCVVSAWGAPSTWRSEPMNGVITEVVTRTRTVVTQPANGGTACPVLSEETRTQIPVPVTPPHQHNGVYVNPALIPPPAAGISTLQVRATSDRGQVSDGSGAFRIRCLRSHFLADDPILFPGQPGMSHMHMFIGNTGANGNSTVASIANSGNSTCTGGIANRSSYWVPAIVDTRNGAPVDPNDNIIYYKSSYSISPLSRVQPFPNGLRVIAGKSATASASDPNWRWATGRAKFDCEQTYGNHSPDSETIPACNAGGVLNMVFEFPSCWNGRDLDSPDHRSHMAYLTSGGCPASHPVPIPVVSLNIKFPVADNTTHWRLASDAYVGPAGYSLHGDIWVQWDEDIKNAWHTNCIQGGLSSNNVLCDGRTLY